MEGLIYTLLATFICTLGGIAYKHPHEYATYVMPTMTVICVAAMAGMGGYFVGTLTALGAAVDVMSDRAFPHEYFSKIMDAIQKKELPGFLWMGNLCLLFYVMILTHLPRIGLIAPRAGSP